MKPGESQAGAGGLGSSGGRENEITRQFPVAKERKERRGGIHLRQ